MACGLRGGILATGGRAPLTPDNNGAGAPVILWDTTKTIKVGDLETFQPLRALRGHTRAIRQLAFLPPDGQRLVSAGEDGTLRIWDVARGVELDRLPTQPPNAPTALSALAVSPDGQTIVAGFENGDLFRLNARSEERRVGKECRSRWSPYH